MPSSQQPPSGPPPRFVPTLTEVVQIDAPEPEPLQTLAPPVPSEVQHAESAPLVASDAAEDEVMAIALPTPQLPGAPPSAVPATASLPDGIEEYLVHRVMQRVDVVLDQRLREAIATVIQEQTRSIVPRLREEVESVVRHAVYEAVADELSAGAEPPG